jgi:hypothetical protein
VSSGIILRCLGSVVLRRLGVVARCSVGCGVVNWSLGVVFRFNVVRRSSSRCVVSLCSLRQSNPSGLRCSGSGKYKLWCNTLEPWWCSTWAARCIFSRFGGVISWSLGVVARN